MGAVGKESFQMQTSPLDAESFPLAQKNSKRKHHEAIHFKRWKIYTSNTYQMYRAQKLGCVEDKSFPFRQQSPEDAWSNPLYDISIGVIHQSKSFCINYAKHQLGPHAKQLYLYERAVLKRVCADMLENIEDDHFVETHLCKPVQSSPELRPTLLALEPAVGYSIASSKNIRNSEGQLSHGDLLAFCNCGGVQLGRLDLCAAAAKLLSPTKVNFVSYQPYALENGVFVPELRAPQWCRADAILSTLVCREGKKGVHILWTWQCMHAMAD